MRSWEVLVGEFFDEGPDEISLLLYMFAKDAEMLQCSMLAQWTTMPAEPETG